MKVEKKFYESPQVDAVEIIVEQVVLAASVDDYPGYSEEEDL